MPDSFETSLLGLAKHFAVKRSSSGTVGALPNALLAPNEMMAVLSGMSAGVATAIDRKADAGCVPEEWSDADGIVTLPIGSTLAIAGAIKGITFLAGVVSDDGTQPWRRTRCPGTLPTIVYVPGQLLSSLNQQTDQIVSVRELVAEYQAALDIVSLAVWTYGVRPANSSTAKAFWAAVDNLAAHLDSAGEFPPVKWTAGIAGAAQAALNASAKSVADVANWTAETAGGVASAFFSNLSLPVIAGVVAWTAWKMGFL